MSLNLNPMIAKQKPNGNIQCLICNAEVKSKIWTAHVNGKKHRDNIEKLKATSQKRTKNEQNGEEPPSKKHKDLPNEGPTTIPSDFFDSEPDAKTPFRKDDTSKVGNGNPANMIEGLPTGFFDDKKMDERVRETRERNVVLDEEYEKWKEEIGEEQNDREQKKEKLEAAKQVEIELERIDEQMEALKKLNEMEIQKEKRLFKAMERRKEREGIVEDNDNGKGADEDMEDIDLDSIDWRAKDIFS